MIFWVSVDRDTALGKAHLRLFVVVVSDTTHHDARATETNLHVAIHLRVKLLATPPPRALNDTHKHGAFSSLFPFSRNRNVWMSNGFSALSRGNAKPDISCLHTDQQNKHRQQPKGRMRPRSRECSRKRDGGTSTVLNARTPDSFHAAKIHGPILSS